MKSWCLAIVLLGLGPFAMAQANLNDAKELETFLDGAMSVAMETNHVPGAVVAVVKDGKILLAKGYGYADQKTRRKVDPEGPNPQFEGCVPKKGQ